MHITPPPFYLDWFERSYPNIPIDRREGPFCLQVMNSIQGTKPAGRTWYQLLDKFLVIKLKCIRNLVDLGLYSKYWKDGKDELSIITLSTDDMLQSFDNEAVYHELRSTL